MSRSPFKIVTAIMLGATLLASALSASTAQTSKPESKAPAAKKGEEPSTRVPAPTPMPPGKPGGTLNVMLREDLSQGFAVHETATISTVFPSSPCFSNLVMFDPANPGESPDSVVHIRLDYFTTWPHVKNMVPHHNIFNFGRM